MVVSLSLLFEILSIILCLHYLYGEKFYFEITTISFIVFDVVLMQSINYLNIKQNLSLIMPFLAMLYCGFRFGFNIRKILINCLLYILILGMLQATAIICVHLLFDISGNGELVTLLINIFVLLVSVFILKRCKLNKLSNALQSKEKIVVIVVAVVILCCFLFILNFKQNIGFSTVYYIGLLVSIVLIGLTALDIGKHKMKMKEAEAELRLHKLYESSFRNLIDDICAKQHEFDNHINAIYSQHFLYETYDELVAAQKEYCKDIINENHYNKLLSKGNPIILGFLYGKFSEAEKRGIDISYKINIDDFECSVPIYKIVELLGNLIKNAVEALESESDTNKLQMVIREENSVILIKVANESRNVNYGEIQQFFKKGYSKKGDGRGYGLYNVKRICDEYGAQIQCNIKNDEDSNWLMFTVTIYKSL